MRSWRVVVCVVVGACSASHGSSDDGDLVVATGLVPGEIVTFLEDDGALIADVAADATGSAAVDMPAGGTVAALTLRQSPGATDSCSGQITTGVKPGDHLTFASAPPRVPTIMTVWFTPVADAQSKAYTPCGETDVESTAPGVTLPLFDDCHGSAFDLMIVASGGALATPVFTTMAAVTYQDNGALELAGTQTAMQDFTATLQGIGPTNGNITVARAAVDQGAEFGTTSQVVMPTSTTATVVLPYEQGFGAGSVVVAAWPGHDMSILQPSIPSAITVDLSSMPLPSLTAVSWSQIGLSWTTDGAGAIPDAVSVTWHATRNGSPSATLDYQILGAWSDHLNVPPLSPDWAECDPNQGTVDETFGPSQIVAVDYKQIDGYDEFRQQPSDRFAPLGTIRDFEGLEIQRSSINGVVQLQEPP